MTVTAGPYEAKVPRTDFTAVEELAAALEGQAPMLARSVAAALGPLVTVNLARAVRRAVAAGINRDARRRDPEHLAGLYDLLVQGLDQVTDGCTTPEAETDYVAEWLEDTGGSLPPVRRGCVLCSATKGCTRRPGCPEAATDGNA